MLPKQLEKIRDQYVALEKLGELQQKMASSTSDSSTFVLFLTWSTSKFGNHYSFSTYITMLIFCCYECIVAVVTLIKDAFAKELQVKKCIAENVAHCQQKQMLDLHKIAWVHQVYVTPDFKLQLESLLVETGQR